MTIDPKKLKELHDKLKATEIDAAHIAEHALAASQTLCSAPAHRKVNLNALIGISAFAQAMYELSDFEEDEGRLIDAEIDKAATRIVLGWKERQDARQAEPAPSVPVDMPNLEGSVVVLVFGPRAPKSNLH